MPDSLTDPRLGNLTDLPCPLCGHPLYEYLGLVWCSHVESGRGSRHSCTYGMLAEVTMAQYQEEMKPKKLPRPQGPGFYIFDGIRTSPSGKFITSLRDLVEIRRKIVGDRRILLVYHFAVHQHYAVDMYQGTWTRVPINFGGKRVI